MKDYLDTSLSFKERAKSLLKELTLDEKIGFLISENPPVERLNIPAYDWWNEGLHGLARSGIATVFPQSIAMAATWNTDLLFEVAQVISTEFRAKSNAHAKLGHVDKYVNTNALSPNINIFRDPRWGRGHETYGECPTLTGKMGVAFVKGMQGDDKYLKTACCAKHYAVHSGPEGERGGFDSVVSEKDLYETYLPAFETLVRDAKVESVMSAYNSVWKIPCSANKRLLTDILRDEMGFEGVALSDATAVEQVMTSHKYKNTEEEVAAACVLAGLDLDLILPRGYYDKLSHAIDQGLLTEKDIDTACERVLTLRLKMGLFAEDCPWTDIPYEVIACEKHKALSEKAAEEAIVLLKNDGILPLNVNKYKNILVTGPNAHNYEVNYGNYFGTSDSMVTIFDGIRNYAKDSKVTYTLGATIDGSPFSSCVEDLEYGFYEAEILAQNADLIIFVGGLNAEIEGEAGDATNSDAGGDRKSLNLPGVQDKLIEKLSALGKPLIVINIAGGPVSLNIAQEKANAVLQAMYLGERAGNAMAKVLFGDVAPSGKLPYTVPYSAEDLPEFTDYSMVGRTYRYMEKEPLYPFGFGLSYTKFEYSDLKVQKEEDINNLNSIPPSFAEGKCHPQQSEIVGGQICISFKVKNVGDCEGFEVCQGYISLPDAPCRVPIRDLFDFKKINLKPGEEKEVSLILPKKRISYIDPEGKKQEYKGKVKISVGGSQGDERSLSLGMNKNMVVEI
ncbi:MAG: glycoside hydrolase family 3 C-terminal domain-containing protein [Abditibacteriota bacterium]|nr:glycoside hydrolase family 3 C-terminal domain-containing protein [Abditibacteriota bacterium]